MHSAPSVGPSRSASTDHDLVLVGAGPAALTVAAFARAHRPDVRIAAVDPSGGWLARWHHQMAAQGISHLRSAGVHHPHPDPGALLRSAEDPDDLRPPYLHPSVARFASFCADVVDEHGLRDAVIAANVAAVVPGDGDVVVALSDGRRVRAGRVVVASNVRRLRWPAWALTARRCGPHLGLRPASAIDLRRDRPIGETVAVIGGGLTAAQLALGAAGAGAQVTVVARRPLEARAFDIDPGWIGPKYLAGFEAERDMRRRAEAVRVARGGGTMPEPTRRQLGTDPAVEVLEGEQVVVAQRCRDRWWLRMRSGRTLEVDRVWLATGADPHVDGGVLGGLGRRRPIARVEGLPVLDEDLSWAGSRVHVVGALAALRLGPAAGNLAGARAGAARVVSAMTGGAVDW